MKILLFFVFAALQTLNTDMTAPLKRYIAQRETEIEYIPEDRKADLRLLVDYILAKKQEGKDVRLLFVCTHNSRRSHMAQMWATASAAYYGIKNISCYSGGTDVTAFNKNAIDALTRAGFIIQQQSNTANPLYAVKGWRGDESIQAFSKKYTDAVNPHNEFCAVMTCSQADAACPFVTGADGRVSIPYDDPKISDGTGNETKIYDERCAQIAREMLWVMKHVNNP